MIALLPARWAGIAMNLITLMIISEIFLHIEAFTVVSYKVFILVYLPVNNSWFVNICLIYKLRLYYHQQG